MLRISERYSWRPRSRSSPSRAQQCGWAFYWRGGLPVKETHPTNTSRHRSLSRIAVASGSFRTRTRTGAPTDLHLRPSAKAASRKRDTSHLGQAPAGKTTSAHRPQRANGPGGTLPAEPAAGPGPDTGERTRLYPVRFPRRGLRSPAAPVAGGSGLHRDRRGRCRFLPWITACAAGHSEDHPAQPAMVRHTNRLIPKHRPERRTRRQNRRRGNQLRIDILRCPKAPNSTSPSPAAWGAA